MKKILLIGWKDVTLAFRDPAALTLMLAAPFVLTLGLGFVSGRFSGTASPGLANIPVVVVNEDGELLGNELLAALQSPELGGLLAPAVVDDRALARAHVDEDRVAAAILIPAGFTRSILSAPGAGETAGVQIVLYSNPSRPTSAGVVKTIVEEFVSQVEVGRVAGQVAVTQLLDQGLIQPQEAARVGGKIGARLADPAERQHLGYASKRDGPR
jgi:ABC-2 type transport system permease protein